MRHIVVMGVAGCGKTTIGEMLAGRLSLQFADGDDYHPPDNVQKMSEGIPLTDADRIPWLDALNVLMRDSESPMVISCSALRQAYRRRVSQDLDVLFVHLDVSEQVVLQRVGDRQHFFPASLVKDQFDVLEIPEPTEALIVDAEQSADAVVEEIYRQLG